MNNELAADLDTLGRAGLLRALRDVSRRDGANVLLDDRTVVDFSSNDYLGLASDSRIAVAAAEALKSEPLGAAAARLVSGNHPLHQQLEVELAAFKRCEAALLFASGYAANIGAIPALVGRRDVIYADELNHASLIDACRLARAELRVLPHCDLDALRQTLAADAGKFRRRLIVVDGVFSMDGDLYPLHDLIGIAREYNAWTYVDDAHGTGVLGEGGRGIAEELGVEGQVDVIMGTLGKALGVSGAFVAGSRILCDYLLNRARSFVYTTGTPVALAAATLAALEISGNEPWRRARCRENARMLRAGLSKLGFAPAGAPDGHIVPVVLRETDITLRVGAELLRRGFLVGAIRPPTVPLGSARLRITTSAAHTSAQINDLLKALADCVSSGEGGDPDDGAQSTATRTVEHSARSHAKPAAAPPTQ